MSEHQVIDAQTAVREAQECCNRIVSVLDDAIGEARRLHDEDLLARLTAAKAAAGRSTELIGKLFGLFQGDGADNNELGETR